MSKYRERARDWDYMAWVKTQPCCAADISPCSGPIEADHMGRRGLSRKADDRTCAPLCQLHHRQRTDHSGPFRDWDRDRMRSWLAEQVHLTQARWMRQQGAGIPF